MYEIIEKTELNKPDCKIFKYTIKFGEKRPDGDSCIFLQRFKTLKNPMSGISDRQISRWRKLGLKNEDFFACLDDFYPHGRHFQGREKYFRKGLGKRILAELLTKIKLFKPKLIYAIPTNDEIKDFLMSQGWQSDLRNRKIIYKLMC